MMDLHPLMVGSHFLLSIVALAPAVVAVLITRDHLAGIERPRVDIRAKVAGLLLALLCAVIVSGVVVTSSGPHSGDADVTRRFWNLGLAATIHVRIVIAFVIVGIGVWLWHHRSKVVDPAFNRLAMYFVPLLITQIILGEYQYRNGMRWGVIVFHVCVAGVLFAVATAAAWRLGHPPVETEVAVSDDGQPASARHSSITAGA